MNIVLVNADMLNFKNIIDSSSLGKPEYRPPLGLAYVASAIENNNNVFIIDNYLEEKENATIIKDIFKKRPDIVGFSTTTTNLDNTFKLAKMIKLKSRKIIIVFGGHHVTLFPEETMKACKYCDYIIVGEGEITFKELIYNIRNKLDLKSIDGLVYRNKNKIVINRNRLIIKDLDSLKYPARHLLKMDHYDKHGSMITVKPTTSIISSRGCPFNCSFCASTKWNRVYRSRNPNLIVNEIEFLIKKYGIKGFYFREDNFTVNKQKVLKFCEALKKRKLNIEWECESRVDTIDKDTLTAMYNCGCRGIWCGVESGSQRILKFLNKKITIKQIKIFYKNCHSLGITTGALFMIGIPTETLDDIKKTYNLAKQINPSWVAFQAYVGFPGCSLYNYVKENKLYKKEYNRILEVETKELNRIQIRNLEKKLNKSYRLWKKSGSDAKHLF